MREEVKAECSSRMCKQLDEQKLGLMQKSYACHSIIFYLDHEISLS